MLFSLIDIRERKIELKIEATRASAQDRLAYRLKDIACLSNIEKSKAKGDDRKVFEMTMDNNCYYASSLGSGEDAEDGPATEAPTPGTGATITPKPGAADEGGGSEGGG
jgi:hypothetical protein